MTDRPPQCQRASPAAQKDRAGGGAVFAVITAKKQRRAQLSAQKSSPFGVRVAKITARNSQQEQQIAAAGRIVAQERETKGAGGTEYRILIDLPLAKNCVIGIANKGAPWAEGLDLVSQIGR